MAKRLRELKEKYSIAWILWGLAFIVIEGLALWDPGKGDTLSEHVYRFLEGGPARYALLGGFFIWVIIHFFGKGKYG